MKVPATLLSNAGMVIESKSVPHVVPVEMAIFLEGEVGSENSAPDSTRTPTAPCIQL
ncbi:MAG TPA: hypothetical protein VIH29_07100 [Gallionella sp.]